MDTKVWDIEAEITLGIQRTNRTRARNIGVRYWLLRSKLLQLYAPSNRFLCCAPKRFIVS